MENNHLMGAIPRNKGVFFKVWAPFADKVFVTGSFIQWQSPGILLNREDNGIWTQLVLKANIGDEYKYQVEYQGKLLSRNDPYARELTNSAGNSIIRNSAFTWKHLQFKRVPLPNMVIYEMHIGTFHDEPGGPPGNFETALQKLEHLVALGVNTIEIMPSMEFAGGFSWGYNPSFIFAVEKEYGGADAFKTFIDAAHERNIAVILDVVYNHWGPGDLCLWQFDGWQENDLGGIYFYNDWRSETPWGNTRPDYGREMVRQYIFDNLKMWIDEYHVDGFRWDMTAYIRSVNGNDANPAEALKDGWELMQNINSVLQLEYPDLILVAEDLQNNSLLTQTTDQNGAGFHAQWSDGFVHPVRNALTVSNDHDRNMDDVVQAITQNYNNAPLQRIIYTESHDEVANGKARLPEEIWPGNADSWFSKKRSMLGAVLALTSPGIPMLFQGQELLMDKWFSDDRPIDWTYKDRFIGIFYFYQDLIKLRVGHSHTRGLTGNHVNVFHINHEAKVIAYHRWHKGGPGDDVVVVLNFSNQVFPVYETGLPFEGEWFVRLDSEWKKYDYSFSGDASSPVYSLPKSHDGLAFSCRLNLSPYTALILSQEP